MAMGTVKRAKKNVASTKILVAMVPKVVAAWRVDSAWISLWKCKTKGKTYTAGDLKLDDYVHKLFIHLDEGLKSWET